MNGTIGPLLKADELFAHQIVDTFATVSQSDYSWTEKVCGMAAARDILEQSPAPSPVLPEWDASRVTDADEEIVISHNWDELRRFMWDYVGIVRTNKRLERALHRIRLLQDEINDYYRNFRVTNDLLELRNLVLTAELIVRSAMMRHESRGLHFSRDYPGTLPQARHTVLVR